MPTRDDDPCYRRCQRRNPLFNISVFAVFVAGSMALAIRAGRTTKRATDFYTVGGEFSKAQNGFAIAGDYLSAASFLGLSGAIAIYWYDGFLYSIGFLVAWLLALLLVAELLRNTGRFTMADVLSFRLKQRPVLMAAALSTLMVSLFYLLAQMAGAGGRAAARRPEEDRPVGRGRVGGRADDSLRADRRDEGHTTYVQMVKAVLLVTGAAIIFLLVVIAVRGNFSQLLANAQAVVDHLTNEAVATSWNRAPSMARRTSPSWTSCRWASGWCWTAGLPHVLMRFYTVPTAQEARRSGHLGDQFDRRVLSVLVGHRLRRGLAGRAGHDPRHRRQRELRRAAARLQARRNAVFGRDHRRRLSRRSWQWWPSWPRSPRSLPTLLYSLFWKKFNTVGALFSIYGGLLSCLVLIIFSPAVSGNRSAMFPHAHFAWFPLANAGIVSIPLAFLLGIVGTYVGRGMPEDPAKQAEMEVRYLTGVGGGKGARPLIREQARTCGTDPPYKPNSLRPDWNRKWLGSNCPH
ncbi:solute symporter family protein [Mycobacterium tilburgii]|uniref:solute symporter family protein n=1 Tax=Mycobacterium tilburgii TaxID=44467 RepID=UPI0021B296BF|nr:hypothetical protein [Mycobacterium tilburgii]